MRAVVRDAESVDVREEKRGEHKLKRICVGLQLEEVGVRVRECTSAREVRSHHACPLIHEQCMQTRI
eukprot:1451964-Pleurochrysis_carterae.AAC.1